MLLQRELESAKDQHKQELAELAAKLEVNEQHIVTL